VLHESRRSGRLADLKPAPADEGGVLVPPLDPGGDGDRGNPLADWWVFAAVTSWKTRLMAALLSADEVPCESMMNSVMLSAMESG
jgi:hypothetical protein